MNSRERVKLALNHQEPDRIPLDLGATNITGIHETAYRKLRTHLNLNNKQQIRIANIVEQMAWFDDDMADRLEVDVRGAFPNPPKDFNLIMQEDETHDFYYDEWHIGRRKPKDGGYYFDIFDHPLKDATSIADIEKFHWPDPTDASRFIGLKDCILDITENQHRACALTGLTAGVTETASWLRGFENFFIDMASEPKFFSYLIEKIASLKMAYWEKALTEVGNLVDVIIEADDLGSQDRMLMSPRFYRQVIKPVHKKLFDHIRHLTPAKLFFHSCGSIYPVIPDLIDIGVDILNPVQISATNMNTSDLKREFGQHLTFWGGGIDTQYVLGSGSPEEIEDEVKTRINHLAPGGGFIFTTVHCIQANVPPENIEIMWNTFRQHRDY